MKNDAQVKRACIYGRKKISEPCGIRSGELWIFGPVNNHCVYKATDVAVEEIFL